MKTKLTLFLGICLFAFAGINAQTPVVSFETNKAVGESITLKLRSKTTGTISVDWGDGLLDAHEVTTNVNITLTKPLKGNTVKIYNDDLNNFECNSGGVTSADISRAVELVHVYLTTNSLTSLDVSANTNLQTLGVASNQFSSINLTNNIALNNVYIQNNQFDACELNKIYTDLPVKAEGTTYRINNTGNHGANTSNTNIATAKNWTVNVSGDGTGCFTSINSDIVNKSATILSLKGNYISFNENNRGSIHIIDVSGKMIMQLDDIKGVDVSSLYSGLYLVKYNTNGTNGIIKVLMK